MKTRVKYNSGAREKLKNRNNEFEILNKKGTERWGLKEKLKYFDEIHLESTRIQSILKFYSSNFKILVALQSLYCGYVKHLWQPFGKLVPYFWQLCEFCQM